MSIDLFVFQLAIIFLPGLVWARLDALYVAKQQPSPAESFVRAFLFGLSSYVGTFVLYRALGWQFVIADFSQTGTKFVVNGSLADEIVTAIVIGLLMAIAWIYSETYKLFWRLLRWLRATKRYGDEDVWDFTFNSSDAAVEYVNFRDFANRIVYSGWVQSFSETNRLRELVLREAEIYDFDGHKLFDMPPVHLARAPREHPHRVPVPAPRRRVT